MRIAFLGLGLVGGSVARAIRAVEGDRVELVAWSPTGDGPRAAVAAGILDAAAGDERTAIDGADVIVLAGPADTVPGTIARLGRDGDLQPALRPDSTVTDVASTKAVIVAAADDAELPFVGGHPMAGRESSAFGASDAALFVERPWVIVPGRLARPTDVARVESLATACGARIARARASEHDDAVAAVSHLPLVVAVALAESIAGDDAWPDSLARRLAATGWQSATRLARGDPAMGAGMLGTNAAATAARVRSLRSAIDAWLVILEAPESHADAIRARLARARSDLER